MEAVDGVDRDALDKGEDDGSEDDVTLDGTAEAGVIDGELMLTEAGDDEPVIASQMVDW